MLDRLLETVAVAFGVQAQGGSGDDEEVEDAERRAGGGGDAVEALADDGEGVLGGVEEHAATLLDGEAAQTRGAGGDRDGDVEGEERLPALGLPAQDADGALGPQ